MKTYIVSADCIVDPDVSLIKREIKAKNDSDAWEKAFKLFKDNNGFNIIDEGTIEITEKQV